jgi:hypothetical protein
VISVATAHKERQKKGKSLRAAEGDEAISYLGSCFIKRQQRKLGKESNAQANRIMSCGQWPLTSLIVQRSKQESTPASQRGICCISAIGMGGKQDPSPAKSSGDAVRLHTEAKSIIKRNRHCGRRRMNVIAPKGAILSGGVQNRSELSFVTILGLRLSK